jgi:hypothetical protein
LTQLSVAAPQLAIDRSDLGLRTESTAHAFGHLDEDQRFFKMGRVQAALAHGPIGLGHAQRQVKLVIELQRPPMQFQSFARRALDRLQDSEVVQRFSLRDRTGAKILLPETVADGQRPLIGLHGGTKLVLLKSLQTSL